jgi:hypothetical protein
MNSATRVASAPAGPVALAHPADTPVVTTDELPSAHVDDEEVRLSAQVGELEKLLQDAVAERDQARAERDQHKSEADNARQALQDAPTVLPPVFATKGGEGLESIPETKIDSYTASGKLTNVPVDLKAFSLTGTLRYSLAKDTTDRVPNLMLVNDAGQIRVYRSSGPNGQERTIGLFSLGIGPDGVTGLDWKRDNNDRAKHEDFVLVLRNELDQILKVRVTCPEK